MNTIVLEYGLIMFESFFEHKCWTSQWVQNAFSVLYTDEFHMKRSKRKEGRGIFNVSSRVWNAQLGFLQISWREKRTVFLRFRFVFPRRQGRGVCGTKKWGRNIIKMDEMRGWRTQSERDKKENNRKMCSVHTYTRILKPDRVREIWFSFGGEFCF